VSATNTLYSIWAQAGSQSYQWYAEQFQKGQGTEGVNVAQMADDSILCIGGPEKCAQIARHYLGAVAGAGYMRTTRGAVEQSEEVMIVVTPARILTQDFTPETPLYGRLWLVAKRILPPWL